MNDVEFIVFNAQVRDFVERLDQENYQYHHLIDGVKHPCKGKGCELCQAEFDTVMQEQYYEEQRDLDNLDWSHLC